MRSLLTISLVAIGVLHVSSASALAQCARLRTDLHLPGFDKNARAMVEHDDGSGPSLFVGGDFTIAADVTCSSVARWDGASWSPVGQGLAGRVDALAVFDDGAGPVLFAAGANLQPAHILRWDGNAWTNATGGASAAEVGAFLVFDDGTGPALYAAGRAFSSTGTTNVARWSAGAWVPVGIGQSYRATALATHDDGSGPALYCADVDSTSDHALVRRWNGTSWISTGAGFRRPVNVLASFDDGAGPTLWAGGNFYPSLGPQSGGLARWDGANWWRVSRPDMGDVTLLRVANLGGVPHLLVGGTTLLSIVVGHSVYELHAWDGSTEKVLGRSMDGTPRAVAPFDSGAGIEIHACGDFRSIGELGFAGIARFHGATWTPLSPHVSPEDRVACFSNPRDAGDASIFVGGDFLGIGSASAGYVGRWTADGWRGAGSGLTLRPRALCWFDDGGGPVLYAGGNDTSNFYPGGTEMNVLARLVGSTWQPVPGRPDAPVRALAVFDDGSGPALFVTGGFDPTPYFPNYGVRKYDSANWTAAGGATNGTISVLHVHDDGSGPALYAGGKFTAAGGLPAMRIARWNGSTWSAVGSGLPGVSTTEVRALVTFDDGTGPALYAGLDRGFGPAVMKWDGVAWSAVGPATVPRTASALTVWDDGTGPALWAVGRLNAALQVANMVRWDGMSWTVTGSGIQPATSNSFAEVNALRAFDDRTGNGAALLVGGNFAAVDGVPSGNFAVAQGCVATGVPFCFGTSSACPCANAGASAHGCANSVNPNGGRLAMSGQAFVTADTVVLHGSGMTNGAALYFQGSTRIGGGLGAPLYDGLRCVGGSSIRLGTRNNVLGVSSLPEAGGASISARGLVPATGGTRHYHVLYRDLGSSFCTPSLANTTNALSVHWLP